MQPAQRLLTVTATYQRPTRGVDAGGEGKDRGGAKFCGRATVLRYSDTDAFTNGLDDIITEPLLTMKDEFDREDVPVAVWTDWKGTTYRAREEWEYVNKAACKKEDCTSGVRDERNDGMLPEDFEKKVNDHIRDRRKKDYGKELREEHAFLTRDEVLAVRLYTGPSYQPINNYLRQISQLTGAHRREMARHPRLTFSATVGHLCNAIRKLAVVATPEEASNCGHDGRPKPLWRAVRGELPRSFWTPGEQGLVCATDLSFMSASRDRERTTQYMQEDGENLQWEIWPEEENDTGFHCGADVSILSQFAHEEEYAPSTHARRRTGDGTLTPLNAPAQ